MKRIIPIIVIFILLVLMMPTVSASQTVDYTVVAFAAGYDQPSSAASRYWNFDTTTLSELGRFYGGSNVGGGYRVTIPANAKSGYLIIAGYYPAYYRTNITNGIWYTGAAGYFTAYTDNNYFVSSSATGPSVDSVPFNGMVYIPAHTATLYLYVGSSYSPSFGNASGAFKMNNAVIMFTPDPDVTSPDYTVMLQTINGSLQSIYQALLTNGQTETAINNKLTDMANTLLSILSALQSNSGNVSGIVSALDIVNDKLQSTLNQLTSSDADDELTQQILDKMDALMEEIEELNQTINDKANRPPPEDIVPSAPPQLLEPTDPSAIEGRNFITDLLSSQFFLTFLLMVFTLAFIRYVLFGKSK